MWCSRSTSGSKSPAPAREPARAPPVSGPSALQDALGHRFADPQLLATALTHRSAGRPNNERLEFLGDSLLGLFVAEALFHRFPEADEGRLTRLRSLLVKRETLAAVAREIALGEHLRLGEGELKSGGWRRDSILANALEALIGAVYLDGGVQAARALVQHLLGPRLEATGAGVAAKDAKTRLQEYLQGRRLPLPEYVLMQIEGEPHAQRFTVRCSVAGPADAEASASGSSRRRAEQSAARLMLEKLGVGADQDAG